MFSKSTNEKKKQEFAAMLKEEGLLQHFAALKGGEGAVQLQHVMELKHIAAQGTQALQERFAELGVTPVEDQQKLAEILTQRIQGQGGFQLKPIPETDAEEDSASWKLGLSDEKGELPGELQAHQDLAQKDSESKEVFVDAAGEVWPAGMKIVNGHLAHSIRAQGMLLDGNDYGYIHLAAEVEHPRLFGKTSAEKQGLLDELKACAKHLLETHASEVQRADVFNAFIIPPGSKEGRKVLAKGHYDIHVAEFDIVVLVECISPEAAVRVRETEAFGAMKRILDGAAKFVHCITARNTKRINEVSKDTDAVFLFNYFFSADVAEKGSKGIEILQSVWEYTAGWWTAKANLDNSTPLLPLEGQQSQYNWINHCRWDKGIDVFPHLIFRPSLDKFVLKNFTANDIMAMPILYHLA